MCVLRSPVGPMTSRFIRWLVSLVCRDALEFVAFRKCYIEQRVKEFLESNKDKNPQVLLLASGYDTLALRLARRYPDCKFWEIDHPATGNFKNKIWELEDMSKGPLRIIGERPKNLFHACVDLTQTDALAETLGAQSDNYDTSSPTIVSIEGLSMYLTKVQVHGLFDEIAKAVGPGSVATFDMLATKYVAGQQQPEPDIGFATPLVKLYLKLKSEPWLVGLDTEILQDYVNDHGAAWSLASEIQSFGPAKVTTIQLKSGGKGRDIRSK